MTFEIALTLFILVGSVFLFATEKLSIDLVALSVMATLLASGIITAEEGIAGFSNTATITVAAMFVLSAGLFRSGAVNAIGARLARLGNRFTWLAMLFLLVTIGVLSAFINNTAAVAIFMPVALAMSRDTKTSPSLWLIPVAFASMFGGVCTLIGSSTNILVSTMAEKHGQPAFSMFEFAPLGLVLFGCGILYVMLIGKRLLPPRRNVGDLMTTFGMGDYLTEIVLLPEAKSVGKPLRDSLLGKDFDIAILQIRRTGEPVSLPSPDTVLQEGDQLLVRCSVEKIKLLQNSVGIRLKPSSQWKDSDLESSEMVLVETVIAPNSLLKDRTLKQTRFRNRFGAVVLAIRHHGQLLYENLANTRLQAGDALLVEIRRSTLERLRETQEFVLISEVGLPNFRKHKMLPAILVMTGVVVAASLNIFPIVVAAVIGCILMILLDCITLQEAYASIEWRVIFMLAGILSLGTAMESTGAAVLLSEWTLRFMGSWGPIAVLSALYLLTTILTQAMSNNATAILLAPIALAAADTMHVNPRPFLIAVTFAASMSFMTPVAHQVNTLVYGPGQYRFRDFLRVGTPLTVLFWILATWLIPVFWPL
jgi:di/tricarboxylate transporter